MAVNRGPEDSSVLYLQGNHISSAISFENMDSTLRVKRSDNLLWVLYFDNKIHNRVLTYLSQMGLYSVLQSGFRIYDNHLITALVERWRRETHTFHFRFGEATVTLEDVSVIWGLKIDGEPVTGIDYSYKVAEWQYICSEFLGYEPLSTHFKGGHLSLTSLHDHCDATVIDDNSSDDAVIKYTRCVALMIIGGILFPDYQGGSVRLMFLQLLHDIHRVNSYSWGSAALAFLYRELCNATRIGKSAIAGPLHILQIWAWSRIKCLNPDREGVTLVAPGGDPGFFPFAPYSYRWQAVFSYTHTPTHSVRILRDCLERMTADEFNWVVYNRNDADVKPIIDAYDNQIWRSVCPLICFEIVEMHRPNRVMRQFRLRQCIPTPALDSDDFHNVTRIGHRNRNWTTYHQNSIIAWNERLSFVVQGDRAGRSRQTADDYMPWYNRITVRVIPPTVHGVGYRPYAHDMFPVAPQNPEANFSTPSPFSHQSSDHGYDIGGPSGGIDIAAPSHELAGPSGSTVPSVGFANIGSYGGFSNIGSSGRFANIGSYGGFSNIGSFGGFANIPLQDAGPSGQFHSGIMGFPNTPSQFNPFDSNVPSFTDLLNFNPQQLNPYDTTHNRNIVSPIPFGGYSGTHMGDNAPDNNDDDGDDGDDPPQIALNR